MFKSLTFIFFFMSALSVFSQDTLTTKTGLKYVSLKPGTGEYPKDGQKLKVYYHKGTLLKNGNEFDKDINNRTIKFSVGKREVIPGWDEGFKLMKKGERGLLIIPSKLAYGNAGVKDME